MENYLLITIIILILITLILLILLRPRKGSAALLEQRLELTAKQTNDKIDALSKEMQGLTEKNYEQQITLMKTLEEASEKQAQQLEKSISALQESNERKLDEMRKTVDEKLTETLDKRINASFKTVSEQLSRVYHSLGEMQRLSGDVTKSVQGLNSVLTNVKTRGTWAEVQLGNLLDTAIPGMYETNVKTNPHYNGQVEFAVRIPSAENDSVTWLPMDSKFPMEDYIRLMNAAEQGDAVAVDAARKALERRIREEAKKITQYISLPETTPFAVMYLATEGLYAEVMSSRSGLAEALQNMGVMPAGPSTVAALLNTLSMGFKSVAINKKASEVYGILGAAKAQYDKFGELLETARRRIELAGKAIDDAETKNAYIQRKLKNVESLDSASSAAVLGIEE